MTDMTSSTDSVYAAKPWLKNYDLWAPAEINPPNQPLYQILQIASGGLQGETRGRVYGRVHQLRRRQKAG